MKKKIMICAVSIIAVICCAIGGTFAYLQATTESIQNTFTIGNINIELAETTTDYKMVPGNRIAKDPKVTVKANSEACWLFVKIEKSENLDNFISFDVANGWKPLDGADSVYYREVEAAAADTSFDVLADNKVTVKTTVTKQMMDALTQNTYPTLTFTAYAVQKDNIASAAAAWNLF